MRRVALLLGTLLGIAGCGDGATPPALQRMRWERARPVAYEFEYRKSCFCLGTVWWRIHVQGDRITSFALVNPADSVHLGGETWTAERLATIDELFDDLLADSATPGATVRAEYAPTWGFPVEVSSDPHPMLADDEWQTSIRSFRPLN